MVDYINDDAPLAHIRGYLVTRSDINCFRGRRPAVAAPVRDKPFRAMSRAMAQRQFARNQTRPGAVPPEKP